MHAVLKGGKLAAATNCASHLSDELKSRVRERMQFPFAMERIPPRVGPDLLKGLNLQVENFISIRKRNPAISPAVVIASFRSLTRTDLSMNEWIDYYNNEPMPSLEQIRAKSAELAREYRRIYRATDGVTAYWCVGHGLDDAIETHKRRASLILRGEKPVVAIFGSLSRNDGDIKVLRLLSKMMRGLDSGLQHDAIIELVQNFTLAIE